MKRSHWFLGLVLAIGLAAAGCSSGGECDLCETDEDCQEDLICVNFLNDEGELDSRRCGSGTGATSCRVR